MGKENTPPLKPAAKKGSPDAKGGGANGVCKWLDLTVEQAWGIVAADPNGKCDPFVSVSGSGRIPEKYEVQTRVESKTLSPEWNQHFEIPLPLKPTLPTLVKLTLFDHDKFNANDFLGYADIDLNQKSIELLALKAKTYVLSLGPRPGKKDDVAFFNSNGKKLGELQVTLRPIMSDFKLNPQANVHSFEVTVLGTEGVAGKKGAAVDAFTSIKVRGNLAEESRSEKRTSTQKNSKSPAWHERFEFFVSPDIQPQMMEGSLSSGSLATGSYVIVCTIHDAGSKKNSFLGHCEIRIKEDALRDGVGAPIKKKVILGAGDTPEGMAFANKMKGELGFLYLEIRASAGVEAPTGKADEIPTSPQGGAAHTPEGSPPPVGEKGSPEVELRVDIKDGQAYPRVSFLEEYGAVDGAAQWDDSPTVEQWEKIKNQAKASKAESEEIEKLRSEGGAPGGGGSPPTPPPAPSDPPSSSSSSSSSSKKSKGSKKSAPASQASQSSQASQGPSLSVPRSQVKAPSGRQDTAEAAAAGPPSAPASAPKVSAPGSVASVGKADVAGHLSHASKGTAAGGAAGPGSQAPPGSGAVSVPVQPHSSRGVPPSAPVSELRPQSAAPQTAKSHASASRVGAAVVPATPDGAVAATLSTPGAGPAAAPLVKAGQASTGTARPASGVAGAAQHPEALSHTGSLERAAVGVASVGSVGSDSPSGRHSVATPPKMVPPPPSPAVTGTARGASELNEELQHTYRHPPSGGSPQHHHHHHHQHQHQHQHQHHQHHHHQYYGHSGVPYYAPPAYYPPYGVPGGAAPPPPYQVPVPHHYYHAPHPYQHYPHAQHQHHPPPPAHPYHPHLQQAAQPWAGVPHAAAPVPPEQALGTYATAAAPRPAPEPAAAAAAPPAEVAPVTPQVAQPPVAAAAAAQPPPVPVAAAAAPRAPASAAAPPAVREAPHSVMPRFEEVPIDGVDEGQGISPPHHPAPHPAYGRSPPRAAQQQGAVVNVPPAPVAGQVPPMHDPGSDGLGADARAMVYGMQLGMQLAAMMHGPKEEKDKAKAKPKEDRGSRGKRHDRHDRRTTSKQGRGERRRRGDEREREAVPQQARGMPLQLGRAPVHEEEEEDERASFSSAASLEGEIDMSLYGGRWAQQPQQQPAAREGGGVESRSLSPPRLTGSLSALARRGAVRSAFRPTAVQAVPGGYPAAQVTQRQSDPPRPSVVRRLSSALDNIMRRLGPTTPTPAAAKPAALKVGAAAGRDAATSTTELGGVPTTLQGRAAGPSYPSFEPSTAHQTREAVWHTAGAPDGEQRGSGSPERRHHVRPGEGLRQKTRDRDRRERQRLKSQERRDERVCQRELTQLRGQTLSMAATQRQIGRLAHEIAGTDHPVLDQWLIDLNLAQYCNVFREYHITPAQVPLLTDSNLEGMGIADKHCRNKILANALISPPGEPSLVRASKTRHTFADPLGTLDDIDI